MRARQAWPAYLGTIQALSTIFSSSLDHDFWEHQFDDPDEAQAVVNKLQVEIASAMRTNRVE